MGATRAVSGKLPCGGISQESGLNEEVLKNSDQISRRRQPMGLRDLGEIPAKESPAANRTAAVQATRGLTVRSRAGA